MSNSRFTDNRPNVFRQMSQNKALWQSVIGPMMVEKSVDQILSGYGRPIYQSGDLSRSIEYAPNGENAIAYGTNIVYALKVHDGTRFMTGRPYLLDAYQNNKSEIRQMSEQVLRRGFDT